MRTLVRVVLGCVLALGVLFDIHELTSIHRFGWPPVDVVAAGEALRSPSGGDRILYGLFLAAVLVVQIVIFRFVFRRRTSRPRPDN
jgi:hypothetical protein